MGPSVHRPLAHWHSCSFASSRKGLCDMQRSFFPPWSLCGTCKVLEAGQPTGWLIMSQSFEWKQTPCYTRTDLSLLMSQAQGSSQPCFLAFAFHQRELSSRGCLCSVCKSPPFRLPKPHHCTRHPQAMLNTRESGDGDIYLWIFFMCFISLLVTSLPCLNVCMFARACAYYTLSWGFLSNFWPEGFTSALIYCSGGGLVAKSHPTLWSQGL